jgi:outer membrane protein TolC
MAYSRYWKQIVILSICSIPLFINAGAQAPTDLEKLVNAANTNLPKLKENAAFVNASEAVVTEVRHSFLPQIRLSEQLNLGTDNSLSGSYYTFGITPSTSAGVRPENDAQAASGNLGVLYAEYEFFNFGLNRAKLKTAQAQLGLQQAEFESGKYAVDLEVARNYFQLLRQQYRLSADRQNVERYQAIFAIIKALTSAGLQPGSDSSQAMAELSKSRASYNLTLGRIGQIRQQLTYLTGIPDSLLRIDTLASTNIQGISVLPEFVLDSMRNPLLEPFTRRKDIFLSNDQLIRKSYLPKLLLVGSFWARGSSIQFPDDYKSLGTGLSYQRYNYSTGIALTYNLFNGIYRRDRLSTNRFLTEANEFAIENQKRVLVTTVAQADQSLQTIRANLSELNIQSESALVTYDQKLAQYRAGLIGLIDLANASFVLYRSQTDFIESLHEWWLAQLDKAWATGNLYPFIQSVK